jgi:hypothetical protein
LFDTVEGWGDFFGIRIRSSPFATSHKYGRIFSCGTTIHIPASLYQRLKARAANEGSSAKRLILRGVEQVLREKRTASSRKRIKLPLVTSKRPGTVRLDMD